MFRLHAALIIALALVLEGCGPAALVGLGSTAGVAASQERGVDGGVDDATIRTDINLAWFEKDVEMFRLTELNISEGRVLLTGAARSEAMRDEAVRLVWTVKGVREVYNEIIVRPDGLDSRTSANDIWVSQKLKGALLLDDKIKHVNYAWSVVDDAIYLMGVAQDEAEMRRVIAHARDMPSIRSVNSYIMLKNDPNRKASAKAP